jgi:hypothetical protein
MVDEALARKRRLNLTPRPNEEAGGSENGKSSRFEGLKRDDLFRYIAEVDKPVKPAEMQQVLAEKGIQRTTEAVRNSMTRLVRDGKLIRYADGRFGVHPANGQLAVTEELGGAPDSGSGKT